MKLYKSFLAFQLPTVKEFSARIIYYDKGVSKVYNLRNEIFETIFFYFAFFYLPLFRGMFSLLDCIVEGTDFRSRLFVLDMKKFFLIF